MLLKNQLKRLQEDLRRINRAAEKELKKKLALEDKTGEPPSKRGGQRTADKLNVNH